MACGRERPGELKATAKTSSIVSARMNSSSLRGSSGSSSRSGSLSRGITMATAIASLVRNEPVSDDVGMTGEITLTGQVLPIGGLREKVLAAQRYGLKRVILPRENAPDLKELPAETRNAMEFVLVDSIEDVFKAAFAGERAKRRRRAPALERQAARPASAL